MGNDHYDVLVIGSGPGGATTAARVAETGKRVLMLERGDFLPRERDNWNSRAVFGDAKYTANALRVGDHIAERIGNTP
jgi:choline dehydrogenase-like flavoprotein